MTFRFVELGAYHWDFWDAMKIPLEANLVVLNGSNGTGKTTTLDAIRTLLGSQKLSKKRTVRKYVRDRTRSTLLRAVVTNDHHETLKRRPFQGEHIKAPMVTLACLIEPQGDGRVEKRYLIRAGQCSLDELRKTFEESSEWLTPEAYTDALASAGITSGVLDMLTLEDTTPEAMAKKKPKELFKQVREALADPGIIAKYESARENLREANKRVSKQTEDLAQTKIRRLNVEADVARRDKHDRLQNESETLAKRVLAAKLQEAYDDRTSTTAQLLAERPTYEQDTKESNEIKSRAKTWEQRYDDASALRDSTKEEHEKAAKDTKTARQAREQAELDLSVARAAISRRAQLSPITLAEAKAEFKKASEDWARTHAEAEMLKGTIAEIKHGLDEARRGVPGYPANVERTLARLAEAGIAYSLAAQTIHPPEHERDALESALADRRFGVRVAHVDFQRTIAIATEQGFVGPIEAGAPTDASPSWFTSMLDRMTLGSDGGWSDEAGHWLRRATTPYLGREASEAQVRTLESKLTELEQQHGELVESDRIHEEAQDGARKILAEVEDRLRIDALPIDTASLEREASDAKTKHLACIEKEEVSRKAREAAAGKLQEIVDEPVDDKRRAAEIEVALRERGERIKRAEGKLKAAVKIIEDDSEPIDPELRSAAERGELRAQRYYTNEKEGVDKELRELQEAGIPPPSIREELSALNLAVDELDGHVKTSTKRQQEEESAVRDCVADYLRVIEEMIVKYRERVLHLAKISRATVDFPLPKIDPTGDIEKLDQIGLEIKFSFGEEPPRALGHEDFSDGQRVLQGLILILALSRLDLMRFYILDEPFTHLSMDRIEEAIQFLKDTQAQFIITTPTNPDRAILGAAAIVVTMRKKEKGEAYARHPFVGVR